MKIIVADIDGTIANTDHRSHHVRNKPKNWKAFTAGIPHDTVHTDIVELIDLFAEQGYKIILCTGRGEESRDVTVKWFADHNIGYNQLYMRSRNDHRPDTLVKVELLNQIRTEHGEPWLWLDDRDGVVAAIRAEGVRVLQVAEGTF